MQFALSLSHSRSSDRLRKGRITRGGIWRSKLQMRIKGYWLWQTSKSFWVEMWELHEVLQNFLRLLQLVHFQAIKHSDFCILVSQAIASSSLRPTPQNHKYCVRFKIFNVAHLYSSYSSTLMQRRNLPVTDKNTIIPMYHLSSCSPETLHHYNIIITLHHYNNGSIYMVPG